MVDCDYCEESFDDEDSYERHLKREHEGELSRVDKRRVEGVQTESDSNLGAVILGMVVIGGFLVVGFVVVMGGDDGGDGPSGVAHEHGTIEVVIDGEPVDFSRQAFILQDEDFHFDGPGDQISESRFVWHTHANGVTLQYALDTLGISVNDNGTELSTDGNKPGLDGETYNANNGSNITITVDGEPVEPGAHVLSGVTDTQAQAGENVRVVVNSTA